MTFSVLLEEEFIKDEKFDDWGKAFEEHQIEYKIANKRDWRAGSKKVFEMYNKNDWVFSLGSINFLKYIQRHEKCVWDYFCPVSFTKYNFINYVSYLGKILLNNQYTIIPYGDFKRQINKLYKRYGIKDFIFVKPDSSTKIMDAVKLHKNVTKIEDSMRTVGFTALRNQDLIIISQPKAIAQEWRFVVCESGVITSSLYKNEGVYCTMPEDAAPEGSQMYRYWQKAKLVAETASELYQPDDVWVVDVCRTYTDNFHVVEINALACAGLYDCDRSIIVDYLREYDF